MHVATVRFWPFADTHHFPKADTQAAGFGKSGHSAWAASKGQDSSLLKYEKYHSSILFLSG